MKHLSLLIVSAHRLLILSALLAMPLAGQSLQEHSRSKPITDARTDSSRHSSCPWICWGAASGEAYTTCE